MAAARLLRRAAPLAAACCAGAGAGWTFAQDPTLPPTCTSQPAPASPIWGSAWRAWGGTVASEAGSSGSRASGPGGAGGEDVPLTRYAYARAAAKVLPALCNITAEQSQVAGGLQFGEYHSTGSGFVIESDATSALVVTNAHVIGNGKIAVQTADGRVFLAKVRSLDLPTDLCLLQLKLRAGTGPLPVAELGESSGVQIGEPVLAVGAPLSLQKSVSAGIISNVSRVSRELGIEGAEVRMEYLQTDCAINEGNSGGPLVNIEGKVIGIANMKLLTGVGLGFAIPIDFARSVIGQLKARGFVRRPFLGVGLVNLGDVQIRPDLPFPQHVRRGVVVARVLHGGPADRCGLQTFDVIVEVDGNPVTSAADVVRHISDDYRAGTPIRALRGRAGDPVLLTLKPEVLRP